MAQLNTRGSSSTIPQLSCNSVVYANSFFLWIIRDWNQLPTNSLDYKTDVHSFKCYLYILIRHQNPHYPVQMRIAYLHAVRSFQQFWSRTTHGRKDKQVSTVMAEAANVAAEHGSFSRIRQVAPICTPSNTLFIGTTWISNTVSRFV